MENAKGTPKPVEDLTVTDVNGPVTPDAFRAWLDRRADDPPWDPGVSAAETLAEIRAAGESV